MDFAALLLQQMAAGAAGQAGAALYSYVTGVLSERWVNRIFRPAQPAGRLRGHERACIACGGQVA
jgi:hypothetical protein